MLTIDFWLLKLAACILLKSGANDLPTILLLLFTVRADLGFKAALAL
jgi:hypothetical protein